MSRDDRRASTATPTRILLSGVAVAVSETEAGTTRYHVPGCRCGLQSVVGHGALPAAEACASLVAKRRQREAS